MRARVFNSNSTTDFTYIWSLTGNQGNVWKNVTVDIGQLPAGYKVDVWKYWLLSVSHVSVCITCFCLYHMFPSVSHASVCITCFCLYHMFLACISLLAPISSIGLWFMERCDPLMHSNKGYDNTDPKSLCSIIIKHLRQKRVFFKSTVLMKRIQLLYSLCVVSISIIQANN